jgi:hypothetical protein
MIPDPYGLNERIPAEDGDGIVLAVAAPLSPLNVSQTGRRIVTLNFKCEREVGLTVIEVLASGGNRPAATAVYDANVANHNVVGATGSVAIRIENCVEDLDGDGAMDIGDLTMVLAHFGTAAGARLEEGDFDGDGDVDLSDLTSLLAGFGLPCP